MNNFIAEAIAWTGMSAQGVVVGCLGAALSLFYVNNNSLNWKRSAAVLASGVSLSGYALQILTERYKDWPLSVSGFLCFLLGFMAADFFTSLRKASPTLTNWAIKKAADFAKNQINKNGTK